MIRVPSQLRTTEFRFFLIRLNEKVPLQTQWNTVNCYPYFHQRMYEHEGNYGIVTGYGNLIVVDFDDKNYWLSMANMMPKTFTVRTAKSRMLHYYYILEGSMIRKIGIDNDKGERLCDIQAAKSGVVGPGSRINRRFYDVYDDVPISTISKMQLSSIFNVRLVEKSKDWDKPLRPVGVGSEARSHEILRVLGVQRFRQYKCPFHEMKGEGNLVVHNDGHLYCYHCMRFWKDGESFAIEYHKLRKA